METKLIRLSRQYVTALRKHLKQGKRASLHSASRLGRAAMAGGLETLDLARIHEIALARLVLPTYSTPARKRLIKQAKTFFIEATTPIEATHRAARKTSNDLDRLRKTLGRRTAELASSDRSLKKGIVQRKAAEEALKKRGKHHTDLLEQSRLVQEHLRHLTHQILSAQEDKRRKISHELHDEIAQTLLGIHVRLVTLKKEAAVNAKGLKKEIASTHDLVEKSKKILRQYHR